MRITAERVDAVVSGIYAAVGSADGFEPALRNIITLLDGSSGMLFTPLKGPDEGGFGFVEHFDTALWDKYRHELRQVSPWEQAGERLNLLQAGMTATDEVLVPEDTLRKTQFYHEAHVPLDVGRVCCSVITDDHDARLPRTYLSIYRGIHGRAFSHTESHTLQTLASHVRQALQLAHRLAFAEAQGETAHELLNRLASGIALLDRHHRLIFLNHSAEMLCEHQRGLRIKRGKSGECILEATRPRQRNELQRAIDQTLRMMEETPTRAHGAVSAPLIIHGLPGHTPLTVTVLPLPTRLHLHGQAGVALVIEDPMKRRSTQEQLLATLFRLTPAECRIARALLDGASPRLIADHLSISENTVRTHIRSLHNKTAARSTGTLMTLLARVTGTAVAAAPEADVLSDIDARGHP